MTPRNDRTDSRGTWAESGAGGDGPLGAPTAKAREKAAFQLYIDTGGTIRPARGDTQKWLGMSADDLTATNLSARIVGNPHAVLGDILYHAALSQRFADMAIRLREGGRPADSDGTVHAFLVNGGPQSFNEYFLLSFRPDPAPTTIDPPEAPERAFVRAAASAVEEAAAISRDVSLSLVDVGDVVGLERHRGPKDRAVGRFSDRVADRLRQESIREDGVSCVRPGRYSLLHDREVDLDRMQNDLEGYARAVDPDGQSLAVDLRSIALDRDGLDAESVESALTHAVDTFAESGLDAVIFDTLADGEADRLARMRSRLETLETALEQARVECAYRPVCTVADWSVHHLVAEARAVLDDDEMHAGEILRTTADDPALRARVDAALCRRVLTDPSLAARSIAVEVALPSMLDREIVGMLTDLARRSDGRGMILQIAGLEERARDRLDGLETLRRAGFSVALYGHEIGSATPDRLRALPADYIVMDPAFVLDADRLRRSLPGLNALAGRCREAGIGVIFDGVAEVRAARLLSRVAGALVAGAYFGSPVDAAERAGFTR